MGMVAAAFSTRTRSAIAAILAVSLLYPFVVTQATSEFWPRLLPTVISWYLLAVFARTLRHGPPMIERFARIVERGALPDFTLSYCRKVTIVWCAFFALHGAVALALGLGGPTTWWSVYSGIGTYVLLGVLMVAETVFHKWWFRYFSGGALDRLFLRLFPPEATANGRRSLAWMAERGLRVTGGRNSPTLGAGHDGHARSV